MPIPAYQSILAELINVREDAAGEPNLRVSIRFFKFLLQHALEGMAFDGEAYLAAYPDVREAVARGAFPDARAHFIGHGYFEGRVLGTLAVDEAWYLRTYPDIAAAIETGAFTSATDHYVQLGVFEWRHPSAEAGAAFERWKAALLGLAVPPAASTPVSGVAAPPPVQALG